MDFKVEIELSKAQIFEDIDALKKQIDDIRPLPADVEGRIMQKLRLDWNYNSNAIEGNQLDYGETVAFLMTGITAKGKPLKDHLDIRGHNEAINFLLSMVKDNRPISEADIRALHEMILVEPYEVKAQTPEGLITSKVIKLGEYKSLPNHVQTVTGEIHYYASPEETPSKMQELMEWYNLISENKEIHKVVVAALFHHKFVEIHPFDDGNGRLSRMLMNLILLKNDFPPVVIKNSDKQNYYALLSQADVGETTPFVEYIAERLQSSLKLYLKAARGEDIEEDEDIDKQIALFKIILKNKTSLKEKKSKDAVNRICINEILPLINKIIQKAASFNEFFFSNVNRVRITSQLNNKPTTEVRNIENITQEYINDPQKDISQLILECIYGTFKNDENAFDVNIRYYFSFDEYKYRIKDNNQQVILSINYHESLSAANQQKVIKSFMSQLQNLIQANLK